MNRVPHYVIACDEIPDRRNAAVAHLRERGVDPIVWRGFHGRTWGLRTELEYSPGRHISPGHVGLNLGHWALWQHLDLTLPPDGSAVVLEDDAELPADWHAHLDNVTRNLDAHVPGWEFCFVGLAETEPHVWHKVTERIGSPDSRLCRLSDPFGTHAYLVRRSALRVLMDRMTAAERNMDQQLYQRVLRDGHLNWCAVLPTLVRQWTYDYDQRGRPEWVASTLEPHEVADAYPVDAPTDEPPGRPSVERVAATTAVIDPYPCIYRGEFLDEPGRNRAGRSVPVSACGRLHRPCHSRPVAVAPVTVDGETAVDCETCPHRAEMAASVRDRLPLPEGHFNPSLARWRDKLVLATRDSWGHSKVALWELTNAREDWTGEWSAAPIGSFASGHPDAPRLEDPRLFVAPDPTGRGRLHAMFNLPDGYPPKRVQVGYSRFAPDLSGIDRTVVFPSPHGNLYEKNWVPFWGVRELLFVYESKPVHVVFDPSDPTRTWETPNPFPWAGGALRGGAAPQLHWWRDRLVYYHFFHGCLKRVQGSVYTVGCSVFDARPPYRVLAQTPAPIVWPDLPGPGENVVKRYVVWPGGAVPYSGAWHLALGIDDTYCRIVRFPFEKIDSVLSDVPETDTHVGVRDTPMARGSNR